MNLVCKWTQQTRKWVDFGVSGIEMRLLGGIWMMVGVCGGQERVDEAGDGGKDGEKTDPSSFFPSLLFLFLSLLLFLFPLLFLFLFPLLFPLLFSVALNDVAVLCNTCDVICCTYARCNMQCDAI